MIKTLLLTFSLLLVCLHTVHAQTPSAFDPSRSAVILMYHNVSENTPASTSVTPDVFKKHMQYLDDNDYTVWPLFKTLVYLASGKPIPEKTVALTFDDAYKSVYEQAYPILKEKGWPFTTFVTTKYITKGYTNFLSWSQLREMQKFGGDVGNHSGTHPHFVRKRQNESESEWLERISFEIDQSQKILRKNGLNPIWAVAYPYGEYTKEIKGLLRYLGYFALGQHSGAASYQTDFQAIPRFPMAIGFDGMDAFALKTASKNLPHTIISPDDGVVSNNIKRPILSVQLREGNYNKSQLRCYASEQGRIPVNWFDNNVLMIQANETVKPGRSKYNCTAPSLTENGVYYWFSLLWMKLEEGERWYLEY